LRVLLADDHGIVRRGLRALLEEGGISVVAEAADGLEAIRLCEEHRPDLLIRRHRHAEAERHRGRRARAEARSTAGVIILSMHADESYIIRALAAGARAYLLKTRTDEDCFRGPRRGVRQTVLQPRRHGAARRGLRPHAPERGLNDSYHLLTDREKEVLHLLAEGRSNKEVATLLDLGCRPCETHRANLMQKLNLHNTAEIVLYAVRKGIIV
jgi:DNA-binding NarL/FixJ family response regulator